MSKGVGLYEDREDQPEQQLVATRVDVMINQIRDRTGYSASSSVSFASSFASSFAICIERASAS